MFPLSDANKTETKRHKLFKREYYEKKTIYLTKEVYKIFEDPNFEK